MSNCFVFYGWGMMKSKWPMLENGRHWVVMRNIGHGKINDWFYISKKAID